MADEPSTTISEQFGAVDADLTIRSSDGVLFRVHRQNLAISTGAFPGLEFSAQGEIVDLTERSEVLEILFHFTYPRKHPNLRDLNFTTLMDVTEAVEKYEVFSAMNTCEGRLSDFLPEHASEVFVHATKHDYPELVDKTAIILARSPLLDTLKTLPSHYVLPWVDYQAAWHKIFKDTIQWIKARKLYAGPRSYCNISKDEICISCRHSLIIWVTGLERIESISALKNAIKNPDLSEDCEDQPGGDWWPWCKTCSTNTCQYLHSIKVMLETGIQAIPPITQFIKA